MNLLREGDTPRHDGGTQWEAPKPQPQSRAALRTTDGKETPAKAPPPALLATSIPPRPKTSRGPTTPLSGGWAKGRAASPLSQVDKDGNVLSPDFAQGEDRQLWEDLCSMKLDEALYGVWDPLVAAALLRLNKKQIEELRVGIQHILSVKSSDSGVDEVLRLVEDVAGAKLDSHLSCAIRNAVMWGRELGLYAPQTPAKRQQAVEAVVEECAALLHDEIVFSDVVQQLGASYREEFIFSQNEISSGKVLSENLQALNQQRTQDLAQLYADRLKRLAANEMAQPENEQQATEDKKQGFRPTSLEVEDEHIDGSHPGMAYGFLVKAEKDEEELWQDKREPSIPKPASLDLDDHAHPHQGGEHPGMTYGFLVKAEKPEDETWEEPKVEKPPALSVTDEHLDGTAPGLTYGFHFVRVDEEEQQEQPQEGARRVPAPPPLDLEKEGILENRGSGSGLTYGFHFERTDTESREASKGKPQLKRPTSVAKLAIGEKEMNVTYGFYGEGEKGEADGIPADP